MCLSIQANLPLRFWGQNLQATCYLINHLPTPLLSHKTPYEWLHNKPLTYSHIRVFWCLYFVTNITPTKKFDTRARRCLLAIQLKQKGYRVHDFVKKNIYFMRCNFSWKHISIFFHIIDNQDDLPTLLLPLDTSILHLFYHHKNSNLAFPISTGQLYL